MAGVGLGELAILALAGLTPLAVAAVVLVVVLRKRGGASSPG